MLHISQRADRYFGKILLISKQVLLRKANDKFNAR